MVKKCKKCPIEISISSYKLIFVFIFPIFGVLQYKLRNKYISQDEEYFRAFCYYLSNIFAFIFLIIMRIKNRNNIKKEEIEVKEEKYEQENQINEVSKNESKDVSDLEIVLPEQKSKESESTNIFKNLWKNKNFSKFLFIFIILFICATSLTFNHFQFESYLEERTIGMAYKIPDFFILSSLILKYKYFRHHFITFGINILTLIVKYIITLIQSNSTEYLGKHIWFYFLYAISYCFIFIFGKYFMNKFYKSPYYIMFIVGVIMSSILLIISIIKYLVAGESQIFHCFSKYINSAKTFFLFLLDIFLQFIYNLGLWITTYYFTPCHTIIAENFMEFEYYLYDYSDNKKYWISANFYLNFYMFPIIHIINFICSLIFNEIIILNFCNLDYYTIIRIQERERLESDNLLSLKQKAEEDDGDKEMLNHGEEGEIN